MDSTSQPGERRLAIIEIDQELLITMMKEGFEGKIKTIKGLPEDAVFFASRFDDRTQTSYFVFYHPSFPIVKIGNAIPTISWEITNA
jgi:hypothetical protein